MKNGDTFTVTRRHDDGALTVQRPSGGPTMVLPAAYVREHVELAYATTAFRAQGATVDTAHAIVTGPGMTREVLYVMLTRAKESNTVYVCTDRAVEPLPGFEDQPTTARSVLTAVMGNVGAAVSAHETADSSANRLPRSAPLPRSTRPSPTTPKPPLDAPALPAPDHPRSSTGESPAFGRCPPPSAARRLRPNVEAAPALEHADAGTFDSPVTISGSNSGQTVHGPIAIWANGSFSTPPVRHGRRT